MAALVLTLPGLCVPALIQWGIRKVATQWDFHGSRKQSLAITYLAQNAQTLVLKPWRQRIQHLVYRFYK